MDVGEEVEASARRWTAEVEVEASATTPWLLLSGPRAEILLPLRLLLRDPTASFVTAHSQSVYGPMLIVV